MGIRDPGSWTGGDLPNTPPIRIGCRGAGKGGQLLEALESPEGIDIGRVIEGGEGDRGDRDWNMRALGDIRVLHT